MTRSLMLVGAARDGLGVRPIGATTETVGC
jgi:hypothetical protein